MSAMLANFHFIRPLALLLLPLVLFLWWLWQRRSDPLRGWREQIEPELLKALISGDGRVLRGPIVATLAAWIIAAIAIAGPSWRLEPNPFADEGTPLMILLKADASMNNPDPAPSRIERAHLKINDLAKARAGLPLGLIAYAGSAHLVLPPTEDTSAVAQMAAEISPEIMPAAGDRPDLAIRKAAEILGDKGGTIVILADSMSGESPSLATAIRESGLKVHVISINSKGSSQDAALQKVVSSLDASFQTMSADDSDIAKLLRLAESSAGGKSGELGDRWQEAGWWLVPILVILSAFSFRRETTKQGAQA